MQSAHGMSNTTVQCDGTTGTTTLTPPADPSLPHLSYFICRCSAFLCFLAAELLSSTSFWI